MRKLTYDHIKEQIEKEGYQLLSKEYINSISKLNVRCLKGHEYKVTYGNFYQGCRCLICSGKQKYSYEYVKNEFLKKNIELINGVYRNNKALMNVKCMKCGYEFRSSIWKIKRGLGCKKCSSLKYTKEYVEKKLLEEDYNLISEYRKTHEKIVVKCNIGHCYTTTFSQWLNGTRCSFCSGNHKLSYSYIKEQLYKEGYQLLSKVYKNNSIRMKLKCDNNHICHISYGNFSMGKRCKTCYDERTHSKQEKEVLGVVKDIIDYDIIENDRSQIINPNTNKFLELDIWIPELNKAIEFNGEYWHKNRYTDGIKRKCCYDKNIDLLVIWDGEWVNEKEKCLQNIRDFLNG